MIPVNTIKPLKIIDTQEMTVVKVSTDESEYNEYTRYGFVGIICGAQDIKDISQDTRCGGMLRVCPGITFQSHNHGQARTTNPRLAQDLGADYIVIGRSVTQSNDPVETIVEIKKTLN
jgi:orotidine-5'-phosphate decarboxylase